MKLIAQSENIENIVEKDSIYVDKTEYIYNLTKILIVFSSLDLVVLVNHLP